MRITCMHAAAHALPYIMSKLLGFLPGKYILRFRYDCEATAQV